MQIKLERTLTPEDMGPSYCAICGDEFELGTVSAWAYGESRTTVSDTEPCVCPSCVEMLGSYRPDRFPTIEEYRRRQEQWPTPLYASGAEADEAFLRA